jgi:hypothetical protein
MNALSNESSSGSALSLMLGQERSSVITTAFESIRHTRTHYEAAGRDETRRRLAALYDELCAAVSSRDLGGIIGYARDLAAERFQSGYDLSEVQSAFNALEEATWRILCAQLQPDQLALSLGLVGTVLGAAKDALAREYVSLASQRHVQSLDLRTLFSGGAAV